MAGKKFYLQNDRESLSLKFGFDVPESLHLQILKLSDSSGYMEIPSPWGVSERLRSALILSDYKRGRTREEIRQLYGLSTRSLYNIFNIQGPRYCKSVNPR